MHQLTGTRIRDRRLDRGLKQTDLATAVGISPSYLNLIEHNARRIGGKLLLDIARALSVDPAHLTEGAEHALLDGLRAAAAATPDHNAELSRAEELVGRFPGWAALVRAQARRIALLGAQVSELSDRLTHDSELATALHQVITSVTSIRSAASILVGDDMIDRDWQGRFHRNIHDDSVKLADSSRMLVKYLEGTGETKGITQSPQEDVGRYLDAIDHHVAAIEAGGRGADLNAIVADAAIRWPGIADTAVSGRLRDWLAQYQADALVMPLGPFADAARACDHDPTLMSRQFGVGLFAAMRRLSTLPRGQDHPAMGLAQCDAAGAILQLKRIPGFSLPLVGAGCPLWPLYQALGQPGRGIKVAVGMPGERGPQFLCHALSGPVSEPGFDESPVIRSMMLVRPLDSASAAILHPAGLTCRVCPRSDCPARREPSVLG